jgi:hypothetical protein
MERDRPASIVWGLCPPFHQPSNRGHDPSVRVWDYIPPAYSLAERSPEVFRSDHQTPGTLVMVRDRRVGGT